MLVLTYDTFKHESDEGTKDEANPYEAIKNLEVVQMKEEGPHLTHLLHAIRLDRLLPVQERSIVAYALGTTHGY